MADIRCPECWSWVPIEDDVCPDCGSLIGVSSPEEDREDYERAQASEAWERRGGGGL